MVSLYILLDFVNIFYKNLDLLKINTYTANVDTNRKSILNAKNLYTSTTFESVQDEAFRPQNLKCFHIIASETKIALTAFSLKYSIFK